MIKEFPDIESLNNFAAERFVEIAKESIEKRKSFVVALAGGSTPKSLYQLLASDKFKDKIDWSKVFFFFGDERNVLPEDPESNFRMINESLFERLQIPDTGGFRWKDTNIIRWNTETKDVNEVAEDYETAIYVFFALDEEERFPRFDLILLGMGADGHTASLFPFTEALHNTEKIAVANYVEKLQTTRLTFTFSTINNAANIIFLVAGAEKAETLKKVLQGEFQPLKFPSQNVRPKNGELLWLIDAQCGKIIET